MRIIVANRHDLEMKEAQTPEFFDDDKFFITIKGGVETHWAIKHNDPIRVLRLTFDDVTDSDNVPEEDKKELKLFNKHDAQRIKEFVENLNPKKTLYINCGAGISRSGAVGEVVNEYLNKFLINNVADYEFFFKVNKQIQPNPYIKRILLAEFFGEYDFSESQE
jgi:predicted protein tyrosine phosphatase